MRERLAMRDKQMEDELKQFKSVNEDLEKEMKAMEKREVQLEKILDDLDRERTEGRREIQELEAQLKERNSMISLIEMEVGKVREALVHQKQELEQKYRSQLDKLTDENERVREHSQSLERVVKELNDRLEVELTEGKGRKRDNDLMVKQIKELKKQVKVLLLELDKQREKMETKLQKLKAAMDL